MRLTRPLLHLFAQDISGKDLLLITGGLFLVAKSAFEIHGKIDPTEEKKPQVKGTFVAVLVQILLLDLIFSLDSVITAVGMVNKIPIMAAAVIVATLIMISASGAIVRFLDQRLTLKVLALSFLVLIGVALLAEGFDTHIPKGYIYFAMAYAFVVEMMNIRLRAKTLSHK